MSTNGNIQIIINAKGNINHRTVGIAHEFGHVLLYMRGLPHKHTEPGVDKFIYSKASLMSKKWDMIFRINTLVALVFMINGYLQVQPVRNKILYDIEGKPLMTIKEMSDSETAVYNYISGKDTVVFTSLFPDLVFDGGKDLLYDTISTEYHKYFRENEIEYNAVVFIHILFDSNLKYHRGQKYVKRKGK